MRRLDSFQQASQERNIVSPFLLRLIEGRKRSLDASCITAVAFVFGLGSYTM